MARTVKEIKNEMTATFCKERAVVSAYGLDPSKSFDQQFSPVSIESILFYVFAFAVWVLETLFDKHAAEVDVRISLLEPHTLRWYVDKAKAFMYGYKLIADSDYYDTSGMSETDVEKARVVKFANATESNTVVVDAYNANPTSMTAAINAFQGNCYILGAMRELGDYSHLEHQNIVNMLLERKADKVLLVGPEYKQTTAPYPIYDNVEVLCEALQQTPLTGYRILLKGSRSNQLEKVIPLL